MEIKKLHIKNFKSLVDVEINAPNPFTVFVGPNGSGKSNIFESLEFLNFLNNSKEITDVLNNFGGLESILNRNFSEDTRIHIGVNVDNINSYYNIDYSDKPFGEAPGSRGIGTVNNFHNLVSQPATYEQFHKKFSRIFINNINVLKKISYSDDKLSINASNLENVLKRVLDNSSTKEDIIEWLQIFIPEFEKLEIHTSALSGKSELAIFEKTIQQPLTKNLISDGTYNILAILTAIFQSDEPQFLCIEEPENGLNPFVVKKLVGLFREACETKGHYIWINTHSQTLVNQLKPEELILVNKKDGATTIKQLKGTNLHGLDMDEAWLTNALGGGVPW